MVKKFLSSLPRKKYLQIVASLEEVLDLKTLQENRQTTTTKGD